MGNVVSINYVELVDDGMGGIEPVIVGTKIAVHDIVGMHLMGTASIEWLVENFDLTPAQIHAALSYYYDHKAQIDAEIDRANQLTVENGTSLTALIARVKNNLK